MKLPQKMSEALTNTMIEANIIKKEEHDIYSYCYEFLFENIVYIASIILFGALLHNLKETLIFLLVMIPFRTFAGGLHAPASGLCVVLSYLSYFITMLFCNTGLCSSVPRQKIPLLFSVPAYISEIPFPWTKRLLWNRHTVVLLSAYNLSDIAGSFQCHPDQNSYPRCP